MSLMQLRMRRYRIYMQSRPAIGRTFYDGHVDVDAENEQIAESAGIERVAKVHGHRDWVITKIETVNPASFITAEEGE